MHPVEERLYEALGRPTTCPHGNPIPGYSESSPHERRLSDLAQEASATISRISEVAEREAPALLHYLEDRRLVPSASLLVVEVDEVGRTVRIRADAREFTLSQETAGKIWVVPRRDRHRPVSSTPERFLAAPESTARNADFAPKVQARPTRSLTG